MLASGSVDKTVQLWDTTTAEPLATLTGHVNGITALAFSPDGTTLASASADGAQSGSGGPRNWNVATAPYHRTHGFGKSSDFLLKRVPRLSVSAFNGEITFWNLKTPQKPTVHTGRTSRLVSNFSIFAGWNETRQCSCLRHT